jgi:hypothetical protein
LVGLGLLPRDGSLAAVESIGAAALRAGPRRRRCALTRRRDAEADNMLNTYTSHNNDDSITRFSSKLHRSEQLLLLAHVPGAEGSENGDALDRKFALTLTASLAMAAVTAYMCARDWSQVPNLEAKSQLLRLQEIMVNKMWVNYH